MKFIMKEVHSLQTKVKLNIKDKKLIQLLVQDGRMTISDLAKKVGISKPAIIKKIDSLKEKGVIVGNVLYTDVKLPSNNQLYLFEIQTYLGMENQEIKNKILSLKGIEGMLWYNGPFNLLLITIGRNPQEIVEDLEQIIPINKIRYALCINNWFHPPQVFDNVPSTNNIFKRNNPVVDETDEKIIKILEENPRSNITDIARLAKIGVIKAKSRLKKLKENGAIIRFSTYIDFWACGFDVVSVSFIVKGKKNTDKLIEKLFDFSQTSNIWEFAHEWNINVVFWVRDQGEVSQILSSIYKDCQGILDNEVLVLSGIKGK